MKAEAEAVQLLANTPRAADYYRLNVLVRDRVKEDFAEHYPNTSVPPFQLSETETGLCALVADEDDQERLNAALQRCQDYFADLFRKETFVSECVVGFDAPQRKLVYKAGLRDVLKDGSLGPAMVWLSGGTFTMGENDGHEDDRPTHQVTVSEFSIGQFPVTFEEYDRFCESTGEENPKDEGWGRMTNPVIYVSWEDAKAYCQWLSGQTGANYQLPTSAQWEYACRAGSTTRYHFGDDQEQLIDYAWYKANSGSRTHPVGEKKPNDWQLYDICGNVWEWVQDWYASYTELLRSGTEINTVNAINNDSEHNRLSYSLLQNPTGPSSGSYRVVRGGSWGNVADDCRSAFRDDPLLTERSYYLGFRISRTGPLPSYPFTLEDEVEKLEIPPKFIEGLRDKMQNGAEGPAMVWLLGGKFMAGDEKSHYKDERFVHEVELTAFSIGQFPVTAAEYIAFCEATDRNVPSELQATALDFPVAAVSYNDATAYCQWLSQQTCERYCLLSEAQWEYACRSGTTTRYCYGDDEESLGEYAWYSKNSNGQPHPVGKKRPNHWQLYDMHGNVLEWIQDWYSDAYYQHSTAVNPSGPDSGSHRVIRGGSWYHRADKCRSACRNHRDPTARNINLGFRVSRAGPWRSHPITFKANYPSP